MDTNEINIKLSLAKLSGLRSIYVGLRATYDPSSAHEELLREHIWRLAAKLVKLQRKCKKSAALKLDGTEALAFVQLWDSVTLTDPYTKTLIYGINGAIDQYRKSPLRRIPYQCDSHI